MKIQCPKCRGFETIKHGKRYHKRFLQQVYFCKTCNKEFVYNEDFKSMRHKPLLILEAVYLYNKGLKPEDVSDYLSDFKNINISRATVLSWNKKYKDKMKVYVENLSKIKNGYKSLNKSTLLKKY